VIPQELLPQQVIPQLSFLSPDRLLILLVIPLLIAAYIFATRRKNRRGMRFTNTSMLDVVVPKQSQWRRHLAVALSLLSLVTLTAAFAQPSTQVDVPRERATVVIVIDASQSMQATDVAPNRLAAAKAAAIEFVQKIPDKYNVSVVSMAGNSSILVPPTLAHNTVENAINSIQLQDGTAIGKFQAVMRPHRPTGWRIDMANLLRSSEGVVWPYMRRPSPAINCAMSMASCTSPPVSATTLPISRVMSRAYRSLRSANSCAARSRISARFGAGT
jgi:hypothetical protein